MGVLSTINGDSLVLEERKSMVLNEATRVGQDRTGCDAYHGKAIISKRHDKRSERPGSVYQAIDRE